MVTAKKEFSNAMSVLKNIVVGAMAGGEKSRKGGFRSPSSQKVFGTGPVLDCCWKH